ncbi:MAG: sugar MFS transporter [Flavobacteriales bacterium]|nr:sugar MFS transporter [Flavobacteriales bacterium]
MSNPTGQRSIAWPMTVLTSLFFMWGFITVLNDVLVPHWKKLFDLNYAESLLVQFCFFGAYFIGSFIYWLWSRTSGDPIQRMGYKRGMMFGLLLSALGCGLFAPASMLHSYAAHLLALFILGLGFTVLQIAANPFVAIIGPSESASSRLNLAQAFNSLGTTLAPLIGGALIFANAAPEAAVRLPYLALAAILTILALVIGRTTLPEPPRTNVLVKSDALRHPQLRWGMVAIFCYVGAEVAIGSLIISLLGLNDVLGLSEGDAKHYLSLYWGGAMTGRFLGALALSKALTPLKRYGLMVLLGLGMFALLFALNTSDRFGFQHIWPLLVLIAANMLAFILAGPNPARALGLFALAACGLLVLTVGLSGAWVLWAVIAIGLFNSIMWSNIFTLAIDGLGEDTSQGSSLLVMMILGGALIPPLQGLIADGAGLQISFLLPVACYLYLAWYGFKGSRHTSVPA